MPQGVVTSRRGDRSMPTMETSSSHCTASCKAHANRQRWLHPPTVSSASWLHITREPCRSTQGLTEDGEVVRTSVVCGRQAELFVDACQPTFAHNSL
uniref:Uncharacterized protein n=1 Tax=Knipowitschia caucasica TaxID=637954 RepID=A0AAV2MS92_KNICA